MHGQQNKNTVSIYIQTYIHAFVYPQVCHRDSRMWKKSWFHNYTKFLWFKYYKHVTEHYYRSSSHTNIHLQSKRNVYL